MDIDALPTPPLITDKVLAENDAQQKALARRHKAPKHGPYERANNIIKETEAVPEELLSIFQIEDYAEALASVGRFGDAAKFNTAQAELYRQNDDAVWRADNEKPCDCPPTFDREGREYDARFQLREIFSEKTGSLVMVNACNKCGALSVR